MTFNIPSLLVIIGLFTLRVLAACSSYGVDYVNGGSYDIDSSSNDNFTFTTIFQGCNQESVTPILIDPNNVQYLCSAVNTTPAGEQVTSTCAIAYSAMTSGLYKIVLSGTSIGVQRTIALTVGTPATIIITATPTVVVGVTSTPDATTIYKTIAQTQTVVLSPGTVTKPCDGTTQTVTIVPSAPTTTTTYVITRTITDEMTTKHSTTTITKTGTCHYVTTKSFTIPDPLPTLPLPTICIGIACIPPGISGKPAAVTSTTLETTKPKTEAAGVTTVTVTETTYTVTSTIVTTIPASTTTEDVYQTITATVTPAPTTVCDDNRPPSTITITRPFTTATQTDVDYTTTHIKATIWVGETKYKTSTDKNSATSCLRNGGWYGVDDYASTATAS